MQWLDVSDTIAVNLDMVKAIESTPEGKTRIYVDLGIGYDFIPCDLPIGAVRKIAINRRDLEAQRTKYLEQLSKYQSSMTP